MAGNSQLSTARRTKNDEFYTRYDDVEAEMDAYHEYDHDVFRGRTILCPCDNPKLSSFTRYFADNFDRLGIGRLISTSYADNGHGRFLVMERGAAHDAYGAIVRRSGHLEGDGDFRGEEVTALRDDADLVITNPPFSLFREFVTWVMDGRKRFSVIGNINAITYREVFPLLMGDEMWLGHNAGGSHRGNSMSFIVPDEYESDYVSVDGGTRMMPVSSNWFTNIDHERRHEPLPLETAEHNLRYNGKLRRKLLKDYGDATRYPRYDNYDAIEVPFTECIPSDYDGMMGVPITFMGKYDPEQFEIVGSFNSHDDGDVSFGYVRSRRVHAMSNGKTITWNGPVVNGRPVYKRIVIRNRAIAA